MLKIFSRSYWQKFSYAFLSGEKFSKKIIWGLFGFAIITALLTYLIVGGYSFITPTKKVVTAILLFDISLILVLIAIIVTKLVTLFSNKKLNDKSHFQTRLVLLFAFVSIIPTVLMAVFSTITFNMGIESWFSDQVKSAVQNSYIVSEAYLEEHKRNIRADAIATANDLNMAIAQYDLESTEMQSVLKRQVLLRDLKQAALVDSDGKIIALYSTIPVKQQEVSYFLKQQYFKNNAEKLPDIILPKSYDSLIYAIAELRLPVPQKQIYVYITRQINEKAIEHLERTKKAMIAYSDLEGNRSKYQISLALIYIIFAMLILLSMVWIGINIATYITRPVQKLITAAEDIQKGDLSVRVDESEKTKTELDLLITAFNSMTANIQQKEQDLMAATLYAEERRKLNETVLYGVTSAVLGIDKNDHLILANRASYEMLPLNKDTLNNSKMELILPSLYNVLQNFKNKNLDYYECDTQIDSQDTQTQYLHVRLMNIKEGVSEIAVVMSLDDITPLVKSQMLAAWRDVARRIAHEIKNPLTPIQLAAERLKRKWGKTITDNPEAYHKCLETIIRQVEDLKVMVDEFSNFAKLPKPALRIENCSKIIEQVVFLEQARNPDITIGMTSPIEPVIVECDERLISQLFINLLKNAGESIARRKLKEEFAGQIAINIIQTEDAVTINVIDNGEGISDHIAVEDLFRPDVTTHEKGTGLGLAIVQKIVEDHHATITIRNRENDEKGAIVTLHFLNVKGYKENQVST